MLSLQGVSIPFKEVWSSEIKCVRVNPHWTVEQFVWTVKPVLQQLFRLENYEIDIVPINNIYCLLHHIIPELAPALKETSIPIRRAWGQRLDVMFYVRRRKYYYPQLAELNITRGECLVCTNDSLIRCHYYCQHRICEECYCKIIQVNNRCPECRQGHCPSR
jgi:hypothetical protein